MSNAFMNSTLFLAAEIGLGLTIISLVILVIIAVRRRRRAQRIDELAILANNRVQDHAAQLEAKLTQVWRHDPEELARRVAHIAKLQTALYQTVLGMLRDQTDQTPKDLNRVAEGLIEAGKDLIPIGTGGGRLPQAMRQKITDIATQNRSLLGMISKRDETLEELRLELANRTTDVDAAQAGTESERLERLRGELAKRKAQEAKLHEELTATRQALEKKEAEFEHLTNEYMKLYAKMKRSG